MQVRMKNPATIISDAMGPLVALGKALAASPIPEKTRHLIHIRTSQINGCAVCLDGEIAKTTETPQRLAAVAVWQEAPFFSDAERAALGLAEATTRLADRTDRVPDAIWAEAARLERPEGGPRSASPGRERAYWACTSFVALTALGAGTMDILHVQPLYGLLLHLGYPSYFAVILGVWKVLGAIVLVVPRYPLVKEWAYAGMVIDYSSAVISHLASGDGAGAIVGPIFSMVVLAASWHLRPRSRRLPLS